jgi:TonB family protein
MKHLKFIATVFFSFTLPALAQTSKPIHIPIRCPKPMYPYDARRDNQQGLAKIKVSFDKKGNYIQSKIVLSSGSEALDKAGLEASKACDMAAWPLDGIHTYSPVIFYYWMMNGASTSTKTTVEPLVSPD